MFDYARLKWKILFKYSGFFYHKLDSFARKYFSIKLYTRKYTWPKNITTLSSGELARIFSEIVGCKLNIHELDKPAKGVLN